MIDIEDIVDYERGNMSEERMIEFFQAMIDSGDVWKLQGHYERMAMRLIDDGVCTLPGDDDDDC